ncbi:MULTISPECIES: hypothetical protein [unclassified Novosphingobium]|uniref:hypothetical protein n=1 Tax=unclassified Novosphingobium TaxID=2644732 RepID=UPI001469B291|nr:MULTISPECIES: hypothetical protein [unclassified Novosphingobium]NMN06968.1 hypothetical protein [Novosphingobium sp. SG919]NMN89445.1 hypothetical protein [Novosphingobium sp. SG916]
MISRDNKRGHRYADEAHDPHDVTAVTVTMTWFTKNPAVDKNIKKPIVPTARAGLGYVVAKFYPWEYHPDLTEERLKIVAAMLVDGRHAALERYDEEAGDNGWTHGCRAFQFCRHRVLQAIDSGELVWLTAIDRTLQLIFKIGDVPVRIYRGDAEEPTDRTLKQSFGERRQLEILFHEHDEGRDLAYRFAVETDIDGSVLAVKFVGLRGESAVLIWDVPLDGLSGFAGSVGRAATESVELAPPSVGLRTDDDIAEDTAGI